MADRASRPGRAALKAIKGALRDGDWRLARQLADAAAADETLPPATLVEVHLFRGAASSQLGDWAAAEGDFREALTLDPESVHARQGLVRALESHGSLQGLREALALLLDLQARLEGYDARIPPCPHFTLPRRCCGKWPSRSALAIEPGAVDGATPCAPSVRAESLCSRGDSKSDPTASGTIISTPKKALPLCPSRGARGLRV